MAMQQVPSDGGRRGRSPGADAERSPRAAAKTAEAGDASSLRIPVFMPWAWYLMPQSEAPADPPADPVEVPPEPLPPPVEPARPGLARVDSDIKDHVIAAMAIGLVPVPLLDMAALAALQVKMAHTLAGRYDQALSGQRAQSLVAAAVGGTVPVSATAGLAALVSAPQAVVTSVGGSVLSISAASGFASLFKLVPVVGSLAGGATMAVLAGATTYAIGRLLVAHFESGGALLSGDPRRVRAQYRKEFRDGVRFARQMRAWERRAGQETQRHARSPRVGTAQR